MGSPEANFIGLQMVVVKLLIYKSREKVGSATGTGRGGGGGGGGGGCSCKFSFDNNCEPLIQYEL